MGHDSGNKINQRILQNAPLTVRPHLSESQEYVSFASRGKRSTFQGRLVDVAI